MADIGGDIFPRERQTPEALAAMVKAMLQNGGQSSGNYGSRGSEPKNGRPSAQSCSPEACNLVHCVMAVPGQKQPPNDVRSDGSVFRERTPRHATPGRLKVEKAAISIRGMRFARYTLNNRTPRPGRQLEADQFRGAKRNTVRDYRLICANPTVRHAAVTEAVGRQSIRIPTETPCLPVMQPSAVEVEAQRGAGSGCIKQEEGRKREGLQHQRRRRGERRRLRDNGGAPATRRR